MTECFNYHLQGSWGKVMFLHVSVVLFTGGICPIACRDIPPGSEAGTPGEQTPSRIRHPSGADPQSRHPLIADTPQEQTPSYVPPPHGAVHTKRYGQQAGGTHPTGMQSCYHYVFTPVCQSFCSQGWGVHGRGRGHAPLPRTSSILRDAVNERAVCILLECILVLFYFLFKLLSG